MRENCTSGLMRGRLLVHVWAGTSLLYSKRPAPLLAPVLAGRHTHALKKGHAHLLGVAEARQPADVFDLQVGPLQEVPRPPATAAVIEENIMKQRLTGVKSEI